MSPPPRTVAEVMLPGDPLVDGAILVALIARHDGCEPRVGPYRAELQDLAHMTGDVRLDQALQRAIAVDWRELVPTLQMALHDDAGRSDELLARSLAQALHDDLLGASGDPDLERDYLRWSARLPPRHRPFPALPARARLLAAMHLLHTYGGVRPDCPILAEAQTALESAAWDETLPTSLAARISDALELLRRGWISGAVVDVGPAAALGHLLLDPAMMNHLVSLEGPGVMVQVEEFARRVPVHGAVGSREELALFLSDEERDLAATLAADRQEWLAGLTAQMLDLDPALWPATSAALMAPPA